MDYTVTHRNSGMSCKDEKKKTTYHIHEDRSSLLNLIKFTYQVLVVTLQAGINYT